jgi:low temperature requirement protein LtrA
MVTDDVFAGLFRVRGNHHHRVTFIELFFDLVYVFAITQLSHLLLEHLTWRGAFQTLLLAFSVWWAWVYTAWVTNWLDPNKRPVRLVLIGVMLTSLFMSAMIPDAFGSYGLHFAIAFVTMQVGRCLFMLRASREDPVLERNFQRILFWMVASAIPWVLGGIADGTNREVLWLLAVVIDLCGPISGFVTPRLGRSTTHEWASISGGHFAERCQLFLILALGESIVVTGATLSDSAITVWIGIAFGVAFFGSVALWWVYFDRSAEDAAERIAHSNDPGRLARSAYTYLHLPIVLGVIVSAVGDELSIGHPTGEATIATRLMLLGGPTLFLAGHLLFKFVVWGRLSMQRVIAIGALLIMIPISSSFPPLAIATIAVLVLLGVTVSDSMLKHAAALEPEEQLAAGSSPSFDNP